MAEPIVTPAAEEIAPKEGTVEAEIAKTEPVVTAPKVVAPETVPLSALLALKDDIKELKKDLKDARSNDKSSIASAGVEELAKKYPGVDADFITDILASATAQANAEIDKKYAPIIKTQETERATEKFNKAFDVVFDKALGDNPDLPKNIDKEAVKALALTPAYNNIPIADIIVKLYSGFSNGKGSSENEVRTGADKIEDIVDFSKVTADQRARIMEDPKARTKYFAYLDTL